MSLITRFNMMVLGGAAAIVLAVPAQAADYVVNISGGGMSAVGTISTDGSTGTLATANITGFNILLDDQGVQFTINEGNAEWSVLGSGLTATATEMLFNFSGAGYFLLQNPSIGSGMNFICFGGTNLCGNNYSSINITTNTFGGGIPQEGTQVIATIGNGAVPEPGTWAMMLLGFGAVGFAARAARRNRKVAVNFG